MADYKLVPVELIEHIFHVRRELTRKEASPLHVRQRLAQTLIDLLAAFPAERGEGGAPMDLSSLWALFVEQAAQIIDDEQVRLSAEGYLMDSSDCIETLREAAPPPPQPAEEIGEVVVTKDKLGNIVSATRQDAEGRVLSVIAESDRCDDDCDAAEQQPLPCQECGGDGAGGEHEEDCAMVQPAPNPLAEGYFHPLPLENDYEFNDAERFPEGNDCPDCIPALIVRKSELARMPVPDVTQLVEALEPFSRYADALDGEPAEGVPPANDDDWVEFRLRALDYRRARAALAPYRKGAQP